MFDWLGDLLGGENVAGSQYPIAQHHCAGVCIRQCGDADAYQLFLVGKILHGEAVDAVAVNFQRGNAGAKAHQTDSDH